MMNEKSLLNQISSTANYSLGMNGQMIQHSVEIFSRWIKSGSILEMGPADGLSTEYLHCLSDDYHIVEGSEDFCKMLKTKFPKINITNTLFEEFVPQRKYANIILGHVLEHVENPDKIIQVCIEWLEPGGRIIAATPNANSLHRQLAVVSGLISNVHELTYTDISIGHRRVVNPEQLRSYFIDSRLNIEIVGGYYLKSFSNAQIEQITSKDVQKSLMILGEKYSEIAADIYVVATRI